MSAANTINVCLGHLPFPEPFSDYFDVMVSPVILPVNKPAAYVPDSLYGPNGHTLSEYAQLFWILDNLDQLTAGYDYLRILHYRRFVCNFRPEGAEMSSNQTWAIAIRKDGLAPYAAAFDRVSTGELFNTPVDFGMRMIGQYAVVHVLEDLLNFTKFMIQRGILSREQAVGFLEMQTLVPACNIATYKIESFRTIFSVLKKASEFMYSPDFVMHQGHQRRAVGFLLERLNSYILLMRMHHGSLPQAFGQNVVISDTPMVQATI